MTKLDVSGVLGQGEMVWCQVFCREGVLRVDDRLSVVRATDGSAWQVDLIVRAIETPLGWTSELVAGSTGRIRVDGAEAMAVHPGTSLENDLVRQPSPPSPLSPSLPPSYPGPVSALTRLTPADLAELHIRQPDRLSRVGIGLRLILWVPHYIVLALLRYAGVVVLVIGWFAALFMGRLPDWVVRFQQGYLRYRASAYAYLLLVIDESPPVSFKDTGPVVRVDLPPAGRLNRWSVLFRGVLVFPAAALSLLLMIGWLAVAPIIWLVVLVLGRFPPHVFRASVTILQFNLRTQAYFGLLTSRYPRGLFAEDAPPAVQSATPADAVTPTRAQPRAVKAILVGFLVLGSLGGSAMAVPVVGAVVDEVALWNVNDDVANAHHQLYTAVQTFNRATRACLGSPDQFACAQKADAALASAFETFGAKMDGVEPPDGTADEFADLEIATAAVARTFRGLASAPDPASYDAMFRHGRVHGDLTGFDDSYSRLADAINF